MVKEVAFITIHGMGDTDADYYEGVRDRVSDKLGADWNKVSFQHVYYQRLLQDNQEAYYNRVKGRLDWLKMRKFILFGFSDAGGLEYSRTMTDSIYKEVQRTIFDALGAAWAEVGPGVPVVFIAQSLGGQVLSNYIWDAAKYGNVPPGTKIHGIWGEDHSAMPSDERDFRRLKSLKVLLTTGCNIPIFVAGLKRSNIKPFERPNANFVWENYFDEDDILGWPLQDLSDDYDTLVDDKEINAGGFFTSWNPISHTKYWTDKDVTRPLVSHLQSFL